MSWWGDAMRKAFTLMELLIVMAIMSILAMLVVAALSRATEQAKADRTRAIISKLDQLIGEKWEGYRTRAVPIRAPAGTPPMVAARMRLSAIRDLQRMELPDRKADLTDTPADIDPRLGQVFGMTSPSAYRSYRRKMVPGWTEVSQGAECLYLIVWNMRDGDKSALDYFARSEIGDRDGDGMLEIHDSWGRPIEFLRWAPGYVLENEAVTTQTSNATTAPDPFDPLKLEGGWEIRPLIFSSGPDKEFDIFTDNTGPIPFHHYADSLIVDNNYPQPYEQFIENSLHCGTPIDRNGDGYDQWADNITNHFQETP